MSYIFNKNVYVGGEFSSDMFGRLKVAEPFTIFDSAHRYSTNPHFSNEITGTASTTHLPNESSLQMTVGTASGDEITRESKRVFPYQPGKSLQVMQTFVMGDAQANLRRRVGYFSRQNGVYLEQDGTSVYIVKRSYISGSVVNTRVAQADWNKDKLDGTGPSGYTLDLSKAQILVSEYEWLGVGSVRVGFVIDANFVIAHQFNHSNIIDSVYMTTATLPVRAEITNTGNRVAPANLKMICTTVISNGGYTPSAERLAAKRTTEVTVGTSFYPLAAIRLASGKTDAVVLPSDVSILPTSAGTFEWGLYRNPDSVTGGTWTTANGAGLVEYNVSGTSVDLTNATLIRSGFMASDNKSASPLSLGNVSNFELQLGRTNASTPVSDVYVLAIRTISSTANVIGSISWNEIA